MIPELHAPAPFVFFLTAYTDRFHIPVVSNALLLEEPSMYSENNKSEVFYTSRSGSCFCSVAGSRNISCSIFRFTVKE
jgi:hypothetical protein